jgi:hypothetical protein
MPTALRGHGLFKDMPAQSGGHGTQRCEPMPDGRHLRIGLAKS